MLKKGVKLIELISFRTAINFAIKSDKDETFDATFKLGLLFNDDNVKPKTEKTVALIKKRSTEFVDAYKILYDEYKQVQPKEDGSDGETEEVVAGYRFLFGAITLSIPDFGDNTELKEKYEAAYEELEEEYKDVLKELEDAVEKKVDVHIETVNSDKVPRELGYSVLKRLSLMLKV